MTLLSLFRRKNVARKTQLPGRLLRKPHLEVLEDRCVPSGYNFTTLDPHGSTFTQGHDINNPGQIVGDYHGADGIRHGFLLDGGSYTTLHVPGSNFTQALGINASGQIVGTYLDASNTQHGFLLDSGSYTTLDWPNSTLTSVYKSNASGQVVGTYIAAGRQHGFLLDNGVWTTLDLPGSTQTNASGINDDGFIVGHYNAAGSFHGFLLDLSNWHYTTFDAPASTNTYVYGINSSGQIVGQYDDVGFRGHGFLLCDGSYTPIDPPGSTDSNAVGINDAGLIVGTYDDSSGRSHGYLATPTLVATGTTLSATAGQRFAAVVASFTDSSANPGDPTDYRAVIDWGDGTRHSTGGISDNCGGNFDVAASHTYAAAGTYTITVAITDNRDPSCTARAYSTAQVDGSGGGGSTGGSGGGGAFPVVLAAEPSLSPPALTIQQLVANYPVPVAPAPATLVGPSPVQTSVAPFLSDNAAITVRPQAGAADRTEMQQWLDPALLDLLAGDLQR
jgi:hypothetical protein